MTLRFARKKEAGTPPAPLKPAIVEAAPAPVPSPVKNAARAAARALSHKPTDAIRDQVLQRIEPTEAVRLNKGELGIFVNSLVQLVASERKVLLNQDEQDQLAVTIVDEMIGLGPIEPLLQDPTVSDILINGADMIYAERRGKLELTGLHFRNNTHVLHVAQRIASSIGRSVDEASPMLDARLADGSRVNVIIPPLSLNGPAISIRKFSRQMLGFDTFVTAGSVSTAMARALEIAAHCRLNIIVCGGTGSGKTTMLNALSSMIDNKERIVTIEDAAELQLQQEHVVRLETRPPNIEGAGHIDQRALVKNALRMRPDRIIMGECRGEEAFDMMQAMNTGHAGSMSTIHANTCRDALARIENMMLMASANLPTRAIRGQIASAVDMIVHTERMRDGVRRVTEIAEVGGMEEDVITLGSLFKFQYAGENPNGTLKGSFEPVPSRPRFLGQMAYYGLAEAFRETLGSPLE
jgi:pilus assembly protein CpaF